MQGGLAMPLLRARGRVHRGPGPPALPPVSPAGAALGYAFEGCMLLLGLVWEPQPAATRPSTRQLSLFPFSPSPSPIAGELRSPATGWCSRRGGEGQGCPVGS